MSAARKLARDPTPQCDRLAQAVHAAANEPHSYLTAPPENYIQARRVNPDGSTNTRDVALYAIGCEQGRAAAHQYLGTHNRAGALGMGRLHYLVLDMLDAPRDSLLKGRVVGFFNTLEKEVML